jgi:hypothetical protein
MFKKLALLLFLPIMFVLGTAVAADAATIVAANAPQGAHFVGSAGPTCSVSAAGVVTCTSYEIAGVGNANATANLVANYSATVQCRNHGGQIVEVKSQVTGAVATTGSLSPKNGRLSVPSLSSSPAPTAAQFEAGATCPNGNWTKELLGGTITLSSFTYTLTFAGFNAPYITITGP